MTMEEERHVFNNRFDGYVDELSTPCKVFGLDGLSVDCEAIWDTGAEDSVISQDVAGKLNLPVFSKAEMYHAAGKSTTNTHYVYIGLADDIILGPILVMEGNFDGNVILIGMDIIGSGDLIVTNNDDHTELAFSIPSTLRMDEIQKLL